MKQAAVIVKCTDHMSKLEHDMLDACYTCAPFWDAVPTCPVHGSKLSFAGYCRECRKYYAYSL